MPLDAALEISDYYGTIIEPRDDNENLILTKRKYIEELTYDNENEKQQKIEDYRSTHDVHEIHNESWEPQDRCIAIYKKLIPFLRARILIDFIRNNLGENTENKITTNHRSRSPSMDSLSKTSIVNNNEKTTSPLSSPTTIRKQTTKSNQQQNSPTY